MSEEKKHKVELNDETAVKHWAEILHEVKKAYSDHLACGGNIDDNEEQSIYHLSYILDLIKRLQSENQELKCKKILAYKVLSEETLKGEAKADLIERIRILEHNWSCAEESYNNAVKNSEKIFAEQKAEIERLTEEKQDIIGRKAGLEYSYNQVKEKNSELQKQVDELKEQFLFTCKNCHLKKDIELLQYQKEQADKDTAKEILQDLYYEFDRIGDEGACGEIRLKAEAYGVEVK